MRVATAAAAALVLASSAHAASDAQTIFHHVCHGAFEVMPSWAFGFAIDVPQIEVALNAAYDRIKERVRCQCGASIPEAAIDILYDPITGSLNNLLPQSEQYDLPDCLRDYFTHHMAKLDFFDGALASSCTLQTWLDDGQCALSIGHPDLNVEMQVAIARCPRNDGAEGYTRLPRVSVTCRGSNCNLLAKPCSSNSECGSSGLLCKNVAYEYFGAAHADYPAHLFEFMEMLLVYSSRDGDVSPGCYQEPAVNGTRTADNDFIARAMGIVKHQLFGLPVDADHDLSYPKFCGADVLYQYLTSGSLIPIHYNTTLTPTGPGLAGCDGVSVLESSYKVDIPYSSAWNGTLPDLTSAFSTPAILPLYTPPRDQPADSVQLYHQTCGQERALFFGQQRVVVTPNSNAATAMDEFMEFILDSQLGRSLSGVKQTRELSLRNYGINSFFYLVNWMDGQHLDENYAYASWKIYGAKIGNLPETCTYEHWLATGECSLRFRGLRSLILMDVDIDLEASACPGDSWPLSSSAEVLIRCRGADCAKLLNGQRPCHDDFDCDSSLQCTDILDRWHQSGLSDYTDMWLGQYGDPVDVALSTHYKTGSSICSDVQLSNTTSNAECASTGHYRRDADYVLRKLRAGEHADVEGAPVRFCTLHDNVFNPSVFDAWLQGLADFDTYNYQYNFTDGILVPGDGR